MGETPSCSATRRMVTASMSSASATVTAARTTSAVVSLGFGPRRGGAETPQSSSIARRGSPSPFSCVLTPAILPTLFPYGVHSCANLFSVHSTEFGGRMTPQIHAEGLRKRYGDAYALDGFDLSVPAGTLCGLLGPNGARKTTAVRVLSTLLRHDSGVARVAGFDATAH